MIQYLKNTNILFLCLLVAISACSQSTENKIPALAFQQQMELSKNSVLLDVRTPEEFKKEYIANAINMNWHDKNFTTTILQSFGKEQPLFIYCLSGGRSSSAAIALRDIGYTKVTELDGGLLKWKAANLPILPPTRAREFGISPAEFQEMIKSEKTVLVDFNAKWCGPCKKMKPSIEAIEKEMAEKVKVIFIDVDENPALATYFKINAIPLVHVYKNSKLAWSNLGYLTKKEIIKKLK